MATSSSYRWQRLGPWLAPGRWWTIALGAMSRAMGRATRHPFDRQHGVDTDGLIYADSRANGHENDRYSAGYYATAPSLFRGAIALWRDTLADTGYALEDYALLDIGCGKGRVVMLATEYEFREIAGIELNPQLARIARKNLRKWIDRVPEVSRFWKPGRLAGCPRSPILGPGRPAVRIIEGDALDVPLPDGPIALFFFNSFEREMAEMWLTRLGELARIRTHPVDLIYIHPEFDALVRQLPGVEVIADTEIPFSAEDAAADAFQVAVDRCAVYRLRG